MLSVYGFGGKNLREETLRMKRILLRRSLYLSSWQAGDQADLEEEDIWAVERVCRVFESPEPHCTCFPRSQMELGWVKGVDRVTHAE